MRFLFTHTHLTSTPAERPGSGVGSQGLWITNCVFALAVSAHILTHIITHCWHITGRMLHFELMPVTSNNEEIELRNRGKSFDHCEKFCLPLFFLLLFAYFVVMLYLFLSLCC